ncbi:hypothetical protein CIB84_008430 [Bambusicola thoracicus]|uniref:MROH2B-like HEAT-repeats domain-containing protein n=1 Tax=Bambusicola thoracicus TaxID=9083 RepID=A0A2P4SUQ3_BAMTH|nr:hypothetical protein CIB84_008430 [Bambusicola thoracicus]
MQSFLYKALGTVLGACKEVLHIQEKLLQHLEEANAEEPSEAQARTSPATVAGRTSSFRPAPTAACSFVQGMISLLSRAAESNFHTVLDTLTMFASRLCKGQNRRISRRKKMELDSRRAHATHSALILAHGSLALRASKEQLLARLEGDIVGNILLSTAAAAGVSLILAGVAEEVLLGHACIPCAPQSGSGPGAVEVRVGASGVARLDGGPLSG